MGEYQKSGEVSGFSLPSGMKKGKVIDASVYTTTKAPVGEKDVRLNFEETKKLLGTELAEKVRKKVKSYFPMENLFSKRLVSTYRYQV